MFGSSVRNNFLLAFLLLFPWILQAAEKAQVINEGAAVYQSDDFDSPVVENLKAGQVFDISSQKYSDAFYKIRVRKGVIGYIADTDVRTKAQAIEQKKSKKKEKKAKAEKKEKNKLPFLLTQYVGLQYAQIYFREDTMGLKPTANLGFFGLQIAGPDMVVAGPGYTVLNVLFHQGAPKYYETATGKEANGMIFLLDFLFQTVNPLGENAMSFYGLGPLFKYSKFNVTLLDGSTPKSYSMTDATLGAVFNLGAGLRVGDAALRLEWQYYWEKMQYWGLGLAVQMPF